MSLHLKKSHQTFSKSTLWFRHLEKKKLSPVRRCLNSLQGTLWWRSPRRGARQGSWSQFPHSPSFFILSPDGHTEDLNQGWVVSLWQSRGWHSAFRPLAKFLAHLSSFIPSHMAGFSSSKSNWIHSSDKYPLKGELPLSEKPRMWHFYHKVNGQNSWALIIPTRVLKAHFPPRDSCICTWVRWKHPLRARWKELLWLQGLGWFPRPGPVMKGKMVPPWEGPLHWLIWWMLPLTAHLLPPYQHLALCCKLHLGLRVKMWIPEHLNNDIYASLEWKAVHPVPNCFIHWIKWVCDSPSKFLPVS